MKHSFYDVKEKKSVEVEITECVTYGTETRTRYAFKGLTADKRPLTAFVSKAKWDEAKAAMGK